MSYFKELNLSDTQFLAMTSLHLDEFEVLLPYFEKAYEEIYPANLNWEGAPRTRRAGSGDKGRLPSLSDKLYFILVQQKTNPLQTPLGIMFHLGQSRTNYWIHRLTIVLQKALELCGVKPERDGSEFAYTQTDEYPASYAIDGTDRPIACPQDRTEEKAHYTGKHKETTDKNIVLVNIKDSWVEFLSETEVGSKHDKKLADDAKIVYPQKSEVVKDNGFQGYEPIGVLTYQSTKKTKGKVLDDATKQINRFISQVRIVVEHAIAGVKRCRILKDILRIRLNYFSDAAIEIGCGLHNLRVYLRNPFSKRILFEI